MSIDEDEIREYLEGKPLKKNITLSDNSNDYDQGGTTKEEKIGDKAAADKENRLARIEYVMERDKRMQYGDKQAIAEYVTEQNEIRQRLQAQKERQLLEYELIKEEKKRLAKESRITQADRDREAEDIQKLERGIRK